MRQTLHRVNIRKSEQKIASVQVQEFIPRGVVCAGTSERKEQKGEIKDLHRKSACAHASAVGPRVIALS